MLLKFPVLFAAILRALEILFWAENCLLVKFGIGRLFGHVIYSFIGSAHFISGGRVLFVLANLEVMGNPTHAIF